MKKEDINKIFKKFLHDYKDYFLSNEENWILQFNELKKYIDKNKKRPIINDNKILCKWLGTQLINFKNKKQIMENEYIYDIFKNFLDNYEDYFLSNEENLILQFNELKKYIDKNKKRPTKNDDKILNKWLGTQLINFKNKKNIMKEETIYKIFQKFLNDYKFCFKN
jgi:prephenate dehydrogenase